MSSNVTPEVKFASKWQAVSDPKEFAAKISQIPDGPIAGKWGKRKFEYTRHKYHRDDSLNDV